MLKYALGALAAAIILLTTEFVVLTQVTDGGADQRRAPMIIVSANNGEYTLNVRRPGVFLAVFPVTVVVE